MIELTQKRTYTQKHFDKGDGTFVTQAHGGHIHYKDGGGAFQNSDISFVDMGTYWEMTKHNYHLKVLKNFAAPTLIEYKNVWEGANHTITYDPVQIAWVNNPDLSDMVVFRTQQAVTGVLNDKVIKYTGAFGAGIDFEITLHRSGFKKEIVIQSLASLEAPPTANHKLVAFFKYGGTNMNIKNRTNSAMWDKQGYMESEDGFDIQEADPIKKSLIKPAYIIDSAGGAPKVTPIKVFWKLHNGNMYQAKILPKAFLQSAVYPVRADTVTNYFAGSGDGYTRPDGNATWATVRDATTGVAGGSDFTSANGYTHYCSLEGGLFYVSRTFFPVDTSGLDDAATISAARLAVKALGGATNNDNDAQAYTAVVQATCAVPATPAIEDFDQTGTTKGSADFLNSDLPATEAYMFYTFNATGLTWVNKTGTTQLAIREGHDIENLAVDFRNSMSCRAQETASDTSDPYLEVTYTLPSFPKSHIPRQAVNRASTY